MAQILPSLKYRKKETTNWYFSRIFGAQPGVGDFLFFSGVAPAMQTKGRFMNFSQAHSGTKVQCESCLLFPKEQKNTRIHKNGRNSWTFCFGPFFGLVCRGDFLFFVFPGFLGLRARPAGSQRFMAQTLRKTRPSTRVFGPFGPEVPPKCPRECPRKAGCAWECLRECSRDPLSPGPKCVQKVTSKCLKDTFWTLLRHF